MKKVFLSTLLLSNMAFAQNVNFKDVYMHLKNGDYEQAIQKLISKKGNGQKFNGTKNYILGISYARTQDYDSAIKHFKLAIANNQNEADVYYELGQAQYAMNELSDSRKSFISSAKKGFKAPQSYYYVGHISQLLDEHKNAKNYFYKTLKHKETSIDMKQISRFQLAESLLHMARTKSDIQKYVQKYILPQMNKALVVDKKSATAKDIKKRIKEIQREFGLDPSLLVSGNRVPTKKLSASFSQSISYDNNFTLSNDLPGNQQSQSDTYIFESRASASYQFIAKRKYTFKPGIELVKSHHTDREDPSVYSSDQFTITTTLDNKIEHKLFNKPASFIYNLDYKYLAKDRESKKERVFNNRNYKVEIGEKFKYFSLGATTLKLSKDFFRAYDEQLNYDRTSISIDQLLATRHGIFVLLYLRDSSDYFNDITNNTVSNLLRVDWIRPNLFPKTNLNLALSKLWLDYEDLAKSEARGVESTTSYTFKLTRSIGKFTSVDLDYTYSSNDSLLESSQYSKHVTTLDFSLNY